MRGGLHALLVVSIAVQSAVGNAADRFDKSKLDKLFASNRTTSSVHAVRIADGQTLYELNADQQVSPASVTKLFTTAAVLAQFGPAHTFKTKVYFHGTRAGGRVTGHLVVVGDGDPLVISEKLWQLAADLRSMGLKEFTGDLIIDNSLFGGASRDDSRKPGEKASEHAYDAPVSAFGVNFNTLAVAVAPGPTVGSRGLVTVDPYDLRSVKIDNQTKTVKSGQTNVQVTRFGNSKQDPRLSVAGTIPLGAPVKKIYRSISDHVLASGEYLRAFLAGQDITIKGVVREGVLPDGAKLLLEMEGYEVRRIVQGLNTFSNNYIADVLVKRLGAAFPAAGPAQGPGSGTFENGLKVMREFLQNEVGLKPEFVMETGSGLSAENRFSARDVTKLLMHMERRMDLYPEFLASLPAYGWDGTVKKRAKGDLAKLHGLVRAKTGTLTEPVTAVGLGGYFRHPKHGLVAFSILENGKRGGAQPGVGELRERQDEVLMEFFD